MIAKAQPTKTDRLRAFFTKYPKATTTEGSKAVKAVISLASKVRSEMYGPRVNNSATKASTIKSDPAKGKQPMALTIEVPADGVTIRLDRQGRTIGTLIVNAERLQFVRCRARKNSSRSTISWDRLAKLFESGVL